MVVRWLVIPRGRCGVCKVSLRARFVFVCVLLLLALGITLLAANATLNAFHGLQKQQERARSGDVALIRPWMTVPYLAHIYHVPEDYLYQQLEIKNDRHSRASTLQVIAANKNVPVDGIIRKAQSSIVHYRNDHRWHQSQSPFPLLSPLIGRLSRAGRTVS